MWKIYLLCLCIAVGCNPLCPSGGCIDNKPGKINNQSHIIKQGEDIYYFDVYRYGKEDPQEFSKMLAIFLTENPNKTIVSTSINITSVSRSHLVSVNGYTVVTKNKYMP